MSAVEYRALKKRVIHQREQLAALQANPFLGVDALARQREKIDDQRATLGGYRAALERANAELRTLRAEVALLRSGRFLRRRRVITRSTRHWQAKWATRAVAP